MTLFAQPFWATAVAFMLAMVGAVFTMSAAIGNFQMDPAVYGPAVYTVPAVVWSAISASSGFLCFFGFAIGAYLGAPNTGRILVAIGGILGASLYAALVAMAKTGEYGDLVIYYSGILFLPLHSIWATWAIVELLRGWNGRHE